MQDLPVAVSLPGVLGREVSGWAESAGWQVVGLDDALRPALVLAEAPVAGRPTVVVVAGPPSAAQVRSALQAGAVDVLGWPGDRERLLQVPLRIRAPVRAPEPQRVGIAGAAGGVGTSTVALATGALLAWAGRRVLVVGDDDLLALCALDPWRGPGVAELGLLDAAGAAAELPALARPVRGVPGMLVVGGGGRHVGATAGWPVDAVVLDLRADVRAGVRAGVGEADLVCARPDVHLAAAAPSPGGVVLCGDGPLGAGAVLAALGRRPAGRLPWSARVARAGAAGRVPAGLPGTWLRELRALLGRALR